MPMPDLALVRTALSAGRPMISSISALTLSDFCGGQIDLVDDGDDFMVVLDRLIDIGERLRLDPLRGIDDEQRAFACGEAAR